MPILKLFQYDFLEFVKFDMLHSVTNGNIENIFSQEIFSISVLTKQDPEVENDSGLPRPNRQQFSLQTIDVCRSEKEEIIQSSEFFMQSSTSFCERDEFHFATTERTPYQPKIECYSTSPQNCNRFHPKTNSQSPDILSNKVFAELDLVASSLQGTKIAKKLQITEPARHISLPPKVIITPDDAIAKILESEAIVLPSELACADIKPDKFVENTLSDEHLEPLKEEEEEDLEDHKPRESTATTELTEDNTLFLKDDQVSSSTLSDEKLDSVLDSISHDLDYLLNRGMETDEKSSTPTLRRVSKPPGFSVKNKIPEEILNDESINKLESVTLRTEC